MGQIKAGVDNSIKTPKACREKTGTPSTVDIYIPAADHGIHGTIIVPESVESSERTRLDIFISSNKSLVHSPQELFRLSMNCPSLSLSLFLLVTWRVLVYHDFFE